MSRHTGEVDVAELHDAWLDKLIHEVFDAIDTNHDGVISKEEMLTSMVKGGNVGPGVSGKSMLTLNKEVDEVMERIGNKETGTCSFDDLSNAAHRMLKAATQCMLTVACSQCGLCALMVHSAVRDSLLVGDRVPLSLSGTWRGEHP